MIRLAPRDAQNRLAALYGIRRLPGIGTVSFGRPGHRYVRLRRVANSERAGRVHIVENVIVRWDHDGGVWKAPRLSWSVLCGIRVTGRIVTTVARPRAGDVCVRCVESRKIRRVRAGDR